MLKKCKYTSCIVLSLLLFFAIFCYFSFTLVFPIKEEKTIGIIDGSLSYNSKDKYADTNNTRFTDDKTHGDEMLYFANTISPISKIYYFNAENDNGNITDEKIIEGLEWLKENNVNIISISLSTKKYSEILANYFNDNNDLTIFSSYNNLANDVDYPSMYDGVIGVGEKNHTNEQTISIVYRSNNIFFIGNKVYFFDGNSYISVYEALKY